MRQAIRYTAGIILLLFFPRAGFSQATVLGTDAAGGSFMYYDLNDYSTFRQVSFQSSASAVSGLRQWRFCQGSAASPDMSVAWRPSACCFTLSAYGQAVAPNALTASAYMNSTGGGSDGRLPAVTSGKYYTFNISAHSVAGSPADEYMAVHETAFDPVGINSVTQSPDAGSVFSGNCVLVSLTTSSAPAAGEHFYLRYADNSAFTASSITELSMSGSTGTAMIPCAADGTTIYYYVYSSERSAAAILSDVSACGEVAHDMSTLKVNNNAGAFYEYTVLPSAGSFCGNYYVPSSCYPTLASFVNDLNAGTVNCTVTCYTEAGYTETAPSGGINLTQTGSPAAQIRFEKYGTGDNPLIYAAAGTYTLSTGSSGADGIFSLNGSDYITIDGIDLTDTHTGTPVTMEYGYGLFKADASDGCQHDTIENCTITLNASDISVGPANFGNGSRGIFMGNVVRGAIGTGLTITTISGRNEENVFIKNTITNILNGIIIRGYQDPDPPYDYYDQDNTVGLSGAGNTIENFGSGGSNSVYGVYAIYENGLEVSGNTISNAAGGGSPAAYTLYGIFHSDADNPDITITENTITLSQGANSRRITGIKTGNFGDDAGTVVIDNNTIQNCSFSISATGDFYGIDQEFDAGTLDISHNTIQNNALATGATGDLFLIYDNSNSSSVEIANNTLSANSKTVSASGGFYGISSSGVSSASTLDLHDNSISGLSVDAASSGFVVGIRANSGSGQVKNVDDNSVSDLHGGSSTGNYSCGMFVSSMPAGSTVSGNNVEGLHSAANAAGINCAANNTLFTSSNLSFTISGNTVDDISSSGSNGVVSGISMYTTSSGSNISCTGNAISNISASGSGTTNVYGITLGGGASSATYSVSGCSFSQIGHASASGSANVYGIYNANNSAQTVLCKNSADNIFGNAAGDFACGISAASGITTYTLYDNFIQQVRAPAGTGSIAVAGLYLTAFPATVFNVTFNTVALGQDAAVSGGSGFGATCVYYQSSGGTLTLNNNILSMGASVSGSGVATCVRRSSGTAYSLPSNYATSSNDNFYYINPASGNYIYAEGLSAATLVNGWAWSAATSDATANLNNDPCFNMPETAPASFKAYMSPRESSSYYDLPPFAGGAALPQNLKLVTGSTNYAESHASPVAGISTDWEGDMRSASTPDIGADEGDFAVQNASCDLLPIELLAFSGWNTENGNVLQWQTASEKNTDFFEVLRSQNGVTFQSIGNIAAAGNSETIRDYTFNDDVPGPGTQYYRLRAVNLDSTGSFSPIIAITGNQADAHALRISPDPARDEIMLAFQSGSDGTILIVICGTGKKQVFTQKTVETAGTNIIKIHISDFPAGPYLVEVLDDRGGVLQNACFMKMQ